LVLTKGIFWRLLGHRHWDRKSYSSDISLEFTDVSVLRTALRRGVIEFSGTVTTLDSGLIGVTQAIVSVTTNLSVVSLNSG